MGNACSCIYSQPETKLQVDEPKTDCPVLRRSKNSSNSHTKSRKTSAPVIHRLSIDQLILSLSRNYLIKRYLMACRTIHNWTPPVRVTFTQLPTCPEIILIENSLPKYPLQKSQSKHSTSLPPIELSSGDFYEGQWDLRQHKPEGAGTIIYSDFSKYSGYFHDGQRSHQGRLLKLDGDIYEGEFEADRMEGKGTLRRSNGTTYTGEFHKNLESGFGVIKSYGKIIYEGFFLKGMKHGKGKLEVLNEGVYEGEFVENLFEGIGRFVWSDGKEYEGQWKGNKIHGEGTYVWPDKRKYKGEYVAGVRQGYGEFLWPDGREYRGEWFKGNMHGEGFYSFIDASGTRQSLKSAWVNGKREKWL